MCGARDADQVDCFHPRHPCACNSAIAQTVIAQPSRFSALDRLVDSCAQPEPDFDGRMQLCTESTSTCLLACLLAQFATAHASIGQFSIRYWSAAPTVVKKSTTRGIYDHVG
jgi:hypothetical protein